MPTTTTKRVASKPVVKINKNNDIQPTGIQELDILLRGGIPKGANVLLSGNSGSGKTILTLQWLFEGYKKYKEPGIYISLTEPINKALINAKKLNFFDEKIVGPMQIYFTDLRGILKGLDLEYKNLARKDIDTIIEAIGNMVEQSGAKRVILDSITAMAYRLNNHDLIRNFIFMLGTRLANMDVTVFMTSEVTDGKYSVFGVEEFIADGIISLHQERKGVNTIRKLEINKMRGTEYSSWSTTFRISKNGIHLYPRYFRELSYKTSDERITTGVDGLDQMSNGGFVKGSTILLSGASGTGKTLMGLQYLYKSLEKGKKALHYSMEESHDQLMRNARQFGWDLAKYEKNKQLTIKIAYPEQYYLEEHISQIQQAVDKCNAEVIVIDSLSALANEFGEDIVRDFVSRINAYFKEKMATTILTQATSDLIGANNITDAHLSTITDTIIMLRFVEIESELKHALLILKMRGSDHDKKLREMIFTTTGLEISSDFQGFEGVLSGATKKVSNTTEEQLHALFLEFLGPMGETIFKEEKRRGLTYENVDRLLKELGNQGIISVKRKEKFLDQAKIIIQSKIK